MKDNKSLTISDAFLSYRNMEEKTFIVTGFGPFKEHKINASWEAVKLLPGIIIEGAELICEELPVAYKAAEDKMKILWETHSPDVSLIFIDVKPYLHLQCYF